MSKKIALVISNLSGGGAQRVSVTVANGLADAGHNLDLVVLNMCNAVMGSYMSDKVNVVDLRVRHARYSLLPLLKYLYYFKPSVIFSFNKELTVVFVLIRILFGNSFKLISRSINYMSISESKKAGFWHGFFSKNLIKKLYAHSNIIIAQSNTMADDLKNYFNIDEKKLVVINNPLSSEIENFASIVKERDRYKKGYLLCVGRLEPPKDFVYALEAFVILRKEFPQLRLKFVGKGSEESILKKRAIDMGIDHRVDFERYQSEIIPYYLHARVVVLTSQSEGFPNVLIESIALGTPVVAFDCPSGPAEIIQEGINGFLVKPGDLDHLVLCLRKALQKRWNYNAIRNSAKHYYRSSILPKYEDLLADK